MTNQVTFNANSYIASGLYACLDFALALILTHSLSVISGCLTVKKLYDDHEKAHLSSAPLSWLGFQGLATKKAHTVSLLILIIATALTKIGAFAIVGETGKNFQSVPVMQLVTEANATSRIDFTQHVALHKDRTEENLVSSTVLLLANSNVCLNLSSNLVTKYQYTNNLQDLQSINRFSRESMWNSTCVTEENGYTNKVAFQFEKWHQKEAVGTAGTFFSEDCLWKVDEANVTEGEIVQQQAQQSDKCRDKLVETWCVRIRVVYCASVSRVEAGYKPSLLSGLSEQQVATSGAYIFPTRPSSGTIRSMVALLASKIDASADNIAITTGLTIQQSTHVEKVVREVAQTRVNIGLFCATTGTAVGMTVVTCFVAFVLWVRVVVLQGRRGYNRFNSAGELLSYAAVLARANVGDVSEGDDTKKTVYEDESIGVGVWKTVPHVGPVVNMVDREGKSFFNEHELVGM